MTLQYIIIDDCPMSTLLSERTIQLFDQNANILTFTDPKRGIEYLYSVKCQEFKISTILLLDINMPEISGWDVLDRLNDLPDSTKKDLNIYMLTSSISIADKLKASCNMLVSGFIEKPLTELKLESIAILKTINSK
jgi:CheY-like chemotaxis protein